jgi:DNA-binding MarR family transcriptional regulator
MMMNERAKLFEGWQICSNSALKRATRQLGQLYDDVIDASGLRGTQYTLMTQIHMNSGSSLKVLAENMVMDLSALGHTLKPLIRDGLVELVPDEKDRRVKRTRLTEAGIEKWQEATRLWREAHQRFEHLLGQEQAKALRDTLNLIASKDFASRFRAGENKG